MSGVVKVSNDHLPTDPRFPFPAAQTRCQSEPHQFDFANGDRTAGGEETRQRIEAARAACSGCPAATDCLLWALVNQRASRVGIWAATTPRERNTLRKRIADRLGPDWIDVLADQIKARRERTAAARTTPLTVAQARIVRLDNEMNGPMPRPMTPTRQRRNRARLAAATKASRRTRTMAQAS
ncbi:WhiB family transcriptional regulator [Streptomyces sp. NBC_01571]|uniref:WhiB family transcriptional regulator n=1 Tax=Streptomyces sp. NBC_01571 TaxID=2975883 RepID=UPI002258710D|nr:WhiB family transcriptional regulator [Streptomyces sp. NBC_01571]MCX4581257.1 WhiB family transcriptional regulator [Streptomyces sp. NBC_01571]